MLGDCEAVKELPQGYCGTLGSHAITTVTEAEEGTCHDHVVLL